MDAEQTIATPSDEGSPQFLVIHYQENNVDPISPLSDNDMPQASHIEEGFLLAYESNDAFGHHPRFGKHRRVCGKCHGIPLIKLTWADNQWRLARVGAHTV